jgi:hypothetical protein
MVFNQPPPLSCSALPRLPRECYSESVLSVVAGILVSNPGQTPAMAAIEGLPCRIGLLDSSFAFMYALSQADLSSQALGASPVVQSFLSTLTRVRTKPLDASPKGVVCANQSLAMLAHAQTHVKVLMDKAVVERLLTMLNPEHFTALTRWPTQEGGNRQGANDLLDSVMSVLNQPFNLSEAGIPEAKALLPAYLVRANFVAVLCFPCTTTAMMAPASLTLLDMLSYHGA